MKINFQTKNKEKKTENSVIEKKLNSSKEQKNNSLVEEHEKPNEFDNQTQLTPDVEQIISKTNHWISLEQVNDLLEEVRRGEDFVLLKELELDYDALRGFNPVSFEEHLQYHLN